MVEELEQGVLDQVVIKMELVEVQVVVQEVIVHQMLEALETLLPLVLPKVIMEETMIQEVEELEVVEHLVLLQT